MEKKLTIRYDEIGDILYIDKVAPYAEQDSEMLEDEVVARFNPKTGEIETLEILFFSKRLSDNKVLELPIDAHLEAVVGRPPASVAKLTFEYDKISDSL